MEFKTAFLEAMRQNSPREFNRLARTGELEALLQAKMEEAYRMLDELLVDVPRAENGAPRDVQAVHEAERLVLETLIESPLATTE